MAERPKSLVIQLRQLIACSGEGISGYPDWFKEEHSKSPKSVTAFKRLHTEVADELERMQQLNGRLYKTLYPD